MKPNPRLWPAPPRCSPRRAYPASEPRGGWTRWAAGPCGPWSPPASFYPPHPSYVGYDSKSSLRRREKSTRINMACALYAGVGEASAEEIARINNLNATRLSMRRAARPRPSALCLVDALGGLNLPFPPRPSCTATR
jgi:hypothetical protein